MLPVKKEESKEGLSRAPSLPVLPPSSRRESRGTSSTVGPEDGESSGLLGAAVTVRLDRAPTLHAARTSTAAVVQATLLEVRRLWIPMEARPAPANDSPGGRRWRLPPSSPSSTPPPTTTPTGTSHSSAHVTTPYDGPLLAYVRLKDGDHRLSGWVPLAAVEVKELAPGHALSQDNGVVLPAPLTSLVAQPLLSRIYWQVTPGMARTLRSQKPLDYLEERLLRDCQTPTAVRYMVYLQTYIFAPWYYAPYGLLHAEYDPLGPEAVCTHRSPLTDGSVTATSAAGTHEAAAALKARRVELARADGAPADDGHAGSVSGAGGEDVEVVVMPAPRDEPKRWHRDGPGTAALSPPPPPATSPSASSPPSSSSASRNPHSTHDDKHASDRVGVLLPNDAPTTMRINPFIRDAHLCPFSLRLFSSASQMRYEIGQYRADRLRPPGVELYRDVERGFSLFEVNGSRYVTYCRHLFLLGKSFLENKLAGHDVHSYYFYVVCLHHRHAPHFVEDTNAMYFASYFTWEKQVSECNLACIVTLPCFATQGDHGSSAPRGGTLKGLGQFMIAVSYELAYRRRQVGSPEKPLSDLGAAAYQRYWQRVLLLWMAQQVTQHERDLAISLSPTSASATPAESGPTEADGEPTQGLTLRVKDIAAQVHLEEADVHTTLLNMGVLHRCADDRTTQLLIPENYVRWAVARDAASQKRLDVAVFSPDRLLTKKQALANAPAATPASLSAGGKSVTPSGGKRR